MAKPLVSVTTRLKQTAAALAVAEKALEQRTVGEKWATDRARKAEEELDQLHSLLDALEGAPPRKIEGDNYRTLSATTRVGAYLARR